MNRIDQFRAIQNAYGVSSKKEIEIEKIKRFVSQHFKDTTVFEENVLISGLKQKLLVMKNKDDSAIKNILAYPNETFICGQIVDCYDSKWIITEVDANKQIYTKGKMTLCPNILKFQNSSSTIYSYPYYVDSSSPSLSENKTITTSDTIRKIVLSLDEQTKMFTYDKRFMGEVFNNVPQVWEITDLDAQSKSGLLILTLVKDEYSKDADNLLLGICDYVTPTITPTPTTNYVEITYSGLAQIKSGGSTRSFTATFKDSLGNILVGIVSVWDLIVPIGFESYIDTEIVGNTIKIKVLDNDEIIGKALTLNASDGVTINTQLEIGVISLI